MTQEPGIARRGAPDHAVGMDVALVRFAGSLSGSRSLGELQHAFVTGFPSVLDAPMYGYDLVDPRTGRAARSVTANVSDAFVAAYERDARDVDPVLAHALESRRPAYNRALMSAADWEDSAVYRRAYRMHRIRHVVEAPVIRAERIIGCLHFAESDRPRDFGPRQIELAEAVAGVLADTIDRLQEQERRDRERDELAVALDVTMTPVVISAAHAAEPRMNAAARRLLADVIDAEEHLHRLLARPASDGAFSRRIEVELVTGEAGVLGAASTPLDPGLVTVLELQRERPGIAAGALAVLTPREAEVALLVIDGLADREIAERLYLSHHTVSQYVKQVYRKLDVDSRVALTRLLLTRAPSRARSCGPARRPRAAGGRG